LARNLLFLDIEEGVLTLSLTDGALAFHRLALTEPVLEKHRAKSGIEGTWTAYFALFKQALDAKAVAFTHEKQGLVLQVHYPLIAGARITGTFELG